ncbi:MAG: hypothetical protein RL037_484 [Bacteroidota bacterium]
MIIVTGGTGLLGSHLLFHIAQNDELAFIRASYRSEHKIILVKKLFEQLDHINSKKLFNKIQWLKADLANPFDVQKLLEDGTQVYHCSALVSFFSSDFPKLLKQNREITALIVKTCLDIQNIRLCYVSSTAAVGNSKEIPTTENTKWELTKKTSAYSLSKFLAEKEVWRGIEEGLDAVIINPCVILGAGDWNESSLSILKTAAKGISFYTTGSNAVVDARDVAKCMIKLMNSPITADRFLCTGENISYFELFTKMATLLGKKPPKVKAPYYLAWAAAFINEQLQFFSTKKTGLSRDAVNSSYKTISYDSTKLITSVDHRFYSIEETIDYAIKNRIS